MIHFRKAQETDIERIWEIYLENHIEEEEGRAVIGWNRKIYPTKKTAKEALMRHDLFVLEDESGVMGTAVINQIQMDVYQNGNWQYAACESEIMVLHTLVISTQAARKGYAKKFVAFYEQYAKNQGCSYLRMDTNERNIRARTMYEKLGYKEIGIVPCTFHSMTGINMVLLEKKL
ncbi:MAG: GNAT family N-acetyltransferase [Clostridia bacterium]|nr:GNAT family N-acetyltransferase [Clostridia bacterium]